MTPNENTGSRRHLDTGLASLLMAAAFHDIAADEAQLRHEFGEEPFSAETVLLAAKKLGMKAKIVAQPPERLDCAPPARHSPGQKRGLLHTRQI